MKLLSDKLRLIGFKQSRADPDLWMRDADTHYEYIAVYSDDLLVFSQGSFCHPQGIECPVPAQRCWIP